MNTDRFMVRLALVVALVPITGIDATWADDSTQSTSTTSAASSASFSLGPFSVGASTSYVADKLQSQANIYSEKVGQLQKQRRTPAAAKQLQEYKQALTATNAAHAYVVGDKAALPPEATSPEGLTRIREVVRWASRPVWVLCNGAPWFPPNPPPDYASLVAPHADSFSRIAKSTGLISLWDKGSNKIIQVVGTGVVVGPHRILTNKHVVTDGGLGFEDAATGTLKMFSNREAKVDFPLEYPNCVGGARRTLTVTVSGVETLRTQLDVAVLKVTVALPDPVDFPRSSNIVTGDRIAVIGYPSRPGDTDTFLSAPQIDQIFSAPDHHTPFPAERFAAGATIYDPGVDDGYFGYDATTWEGNSGSVVVSLADGKVVGLHSQGLQAKTEGTGYNEAVLTKSVSELLSALPADGAH